MYSEGKTKVTSIIIVVVVLLAAVAGLSWLGTKEGKYDAFAQCLTEEGAVFYGAFWCPHCREQKAKFGSAQRYIPYVECSTPDRQGQYEVCQEQEITNYPTWKFKGGSVVKTGLLDLDELAEETGCELPA